MLGFFFTGKKIWYSTSIPSWLGLTNEQLKQSHYGTCPLNVHWNVLRSLAILAVYLFLVWYASIWWGSSCLSGETRECLMDISGHICREILCIEPKHVLSLLMFVWKYGVPESYGWFSSYVPWKLQKIVGTPHLPIFTQLGLECSPKIPGSLEGNITPGWSEILSSLNPAQYSTALPSLQWQHRSPFWIIMFFPRDP